MAPGIRLWFVRPPDAGAMQALARDCDLAIGSMGPPARGITRLNLLSEQPACCVRRGHPCLARAARGRMRLHDFQRYPHLVFGAQVSVGSVTRTAANDADLSLDPRYTIDTFLGALALAAASDAIAMATTRLAAAFGAKIVCLRPPRRTNPVVVSLAFRDDDNQNPVVTFVRDQLISVAAELTQGAGPRRRRR